MEKDDFFFGNRNTERKSKVNHNWATLIVAGGEDNGARIVADEALGYASVAEVLWHGSALM